MKLIVYLTKHLFKNVPRSKITLSVCKGKLHCVRYFYIIWMRYLIVGSKQNVNGICLKRKNISSYITQVKCYSKVESYSLDIFLSLMRKVHIVCSFCILNFRNFLSLESVFSTIQFQSLSKQHGMNVVLISVS